MRVLLVTDVFPPRCGGSGWSTFHLARALQTAGHQVRIVKPRPGFKGRCEAGYGGVEVVEIGVPDTAVPFLRNVVTEQVVHRRLQAAILQESHSWNPDVFHAQHVRSALPTVTAGRTLGVPSIVTVRDYWPVCYFTTWHVGGDRCPECGFGKMLACMREKSPRAYWAGIPLMPYMRASVRRRQEELGRADAVVAVSRFVAEAAVKEFARDRTHVIPNLIDVDEAERESIPDPALSLPERFVLFVGKLNPWKGSRLLMESFRRLGEGVPLVVVGDGPDRGWMERQARDGGLDVHFVPWLENTEVWRVMRRARLLVVPAVWEEPLSRTVLEGMAAGVPVLATDSGGIHDQIRHGESGWIIPREADAFAGAIRDLFHDPDRCRALAAAASRRVRSRFASSVVLPKFEELYRQLTRVPDGA